ncbi:hypothetical protein DIPPA_59510 [Diplonema papillatum]|nr:hypothetical protein DIPPA_59510 [Diplonema papillatum]
MIRRSRVLAALEIVDQRYPLVKRWMRPVDERISMHPRLDEPIVAEFNKGTFLFCNERYPSVERLADQYFPGFLPRVKEDYDMIAARHNELTTEELMLEQIGLWNITMLVREYSGMLYSGAKLSTPLQWEVAGLDDVLPAYYSAWRKVVTYFLRRMWSHYTAEMVVASPKYKIGGVVPTLMHITELNFKRLCIVYPVCHNDFDVYPEVGEIRYAQAPLDFLLYSHLNYYHVVLNIYKWIMVQEGWCEPTDVVSMCLVNLSITGEGTVSPRLYMLETDDRVREALEMRFSGSGPAADSLSREWFERKELWKEEMLETENNRAAMESDQAINRDLQGYETWRQDLKVKEDVFTEYLQQQQRELMEDAKSPIWRMKNWMWRQMGGQGPITRDMTNRDA